MKSGNSQAAGDSTGYTVSSRTTESSRLLSASGSWAVRLSAEVAALWAKRAIDPLVLLKRLVLGVGFCPGLAIAD